MWTYAKTDWLSTINGEPVYLNNDDYNRIKGNVQFIVNLAQTLYPAWVPPIMPTLDYTMFQIANIWNSIENNLQLLIDKTNIPIISEPTRQIYENERVRNFNDINRIERTILQYYNMLISQKINKPVLQFELGGDFFG